MTNQPNLSEIMAPELPIGSPERAAYFAELSKTFCEDWKAAEEAAEAERIAKKGDLYFIRAGCRAVKIGRTVNIVNRLGKMQADNHEELDCLLVLRGQGHLEADWHRRFKGFHIRGEWFRWTPELHAAIVDARNEQSA